MSWDRREKSVLQDSNSYVFFLMVALVQIEHGNGCNGKGIHLYL